MCLHSLPAPTTKADSNCVSLTVHDKQRIWPFGDLFGVFSDEVILAENEQRAVDSETVLAHRDGVIEGHSPGSLRHRLFVHSLAPGPTGRTVAVPVSVTVTVCVSVGSPLPATAAAARAPAAGPSAVPGRHLVSEPRHSPDTKSQSSRSSSGEGDQCSAARPHNITSHLGPDGSYARRVVLCARCGAPAPGRQIYAALGSAGEDAHVPFPSLRVSASGQLWV